MLNLAKMSTRILDGGLGYALKLQGSENIDADPLWTARLLHTAPGDIKAVHKRFLKAGADVILTASYQASVPGFIEHFKISEREAVQLIKKSTQLAKEACSEIGPQDGADRPLVAGSVGPYGACLHDGSEYTGTYIESVSVEELQCWHRPRLSALVESGVDLLALETIPAQKEAEALIGLVETEFPGVKTYLTYSCKDGTRTCHGELFSAAIVPALQSDCVVGVGVNCTAPEHVTSLLKSVQHQPIGKALIVKPNSGEQYEAGKGWYGRELCPSIHTFAADWLELGATWLGGCCHVFPEDITRLREEVIRWKTATKEGN